MVPMLVFARLSLSHISQSHNYTKWPADDDVLALYNMSEDEDKAENNLRHRQYQTASRIQPHEPLPYHLLILPMGEHQLLARSSRPRPRPHISLFDQITGGQLMEFTRLFMKEICPRR